MAGFSEPFGWHLGARRVRNTGLLAGMLNDPRDLPFVNLSISVTCVVLPIATALYIPGVFRWWLWPLYVAMMAGLFVDRFVLMLHNTSYRPLFKPRFHWLNSYIPWVLGPFFGESPETYFAHHIGMHHLESNLPEDLSSTMPYQRDSLRDFSRYYFKFISRGLSDLAAYFTRKKRFKLRRRMLAGEIAYLLAVGGLMLVNWRATTTVFITPWVAVRFIMMAGNWGQHAFIDPSTPGDSFRNSTTCLHLRYNRRCFNDGYHIGHHLNANRHWTEMPADFEENRTLYGRERAIVFRGLDYLQIWFLLMFRAYKTLAHHYVPLSESPSSEADIVELLKERTRALPISAISG